MKKIIILIAFLPFMVKAQDTNKVFDKSKLSEKDLQNAEIFKTSTGKARFDAFMAIAYLLPHPDAKKRGKNQLEIKDDPSQIKMTIDQLIDLIGEPSDKRSSILDYYTTPQTGNCADACIISIFTEGNMVKSFAFSGNKCQEWLMPEK